MRTLVWVISIVMFMTIFPTLAAADIQQSDFLLDENIEMADNLVQPTAFKNSIQKKSTIQRLSIGQSVSFFSGGALGYFISNILTRYVIGRYANTGDFIGFNMVGIMLGAIFGGQWCDNGWWPCLRG